MRILLHLAYKGTKYRGWQRQSEVKSVQQTLEDNLSRMLKNETIVYGCGRTDAGVHATQYIAHINVGQEWDEIPDPVFRLNKMLPDDISLFEARKVTKEFHSRYAATWRTYDFLGHIRKNAHLEEHSTLFQCERLDFQAMQQGADLLTKYQDYRPLCRQPDTHDSTLCNVIQAQVYHSPSADQVRFHIKANRFLKCMVRITMARLVEIGQGTMTVDALEALLQRAEYDSLLKAAHPQGLYLTRVEYKNTDVPVVGNFMNLYDTDDKTNWIKV